MKRHAAQYVDKNKFSRVVFSFIRKVLIVFPAEVIWGDDLLHYAKEQRKFANDNETARAMDELSSDDTSDRFSFTSDTSYETETIEVKPLLYKNVTQKPARMTTLYQGIHVQLAQLQKKTKQQISIVINLPSTHPHICP
jgi:hypothetical protein